MAAAPWPRGRRQLRGHRRDGAGTPGGL